ncbi:MAG: hypothetical protein M1821_006130 [Bathelium mastoideum]|nr:MAG: hypothetical protein M1821_006130 [Bathelium mastoideum]
MPTSLLTTATLFAAVLPSVAATPGLDYGPAPAPDAGPPLSAHASRDRKLLPAQICGIVGAYLFTIFFLGSALLTFGRRLRRAAQSSRGTLAVEMIKPATGDLEISPISPVSSKRSWAWSPKKKFTFRRPERSGTSSTLGSPGVESVASFDQNVIEQDVQARQQEMERLYAAVMEHDAKKASSVQVNEEPVAAPQQAASKQPLRVITNPAVARLSGQPQLSPTSAQSPRSPIRAIYPPDSPLPDGPASPSSPIRAGQHQPPTPISPTGRTAYPANTRQSRTSSLGSASSKRSRRLRNLRISAPIPKAEGDDDERTPLTPRHYEPGPPPPTPPTATTPGTATTTQTELGYEELDKPQPLPRPAPQRAPSHPYNCHPSTNSSSAVAATANPAAASSNKSLGSLPFRTFPSTSDPSLPPTSPTTPALKTTFVSRAPDPLSRRQQQNTGGLAGPGMYSAGLATPYSAYMPFTPVTPVTPRLVGKRERKERKKEEGRRVVTREDEVVPEGEMWGSGY